MKTAHKIALITFFIVLPMVFLMLFFGCDIAYPEDVWSFEKPEVGETTIGNLPIHGVGWLNKNTQYSVTGEFKIIKVMGNGILIDLVKLYNHKSQYNKIKELMPIFVPFVEE